MTRRIEEAMRIFKKNDCSGYSAATNRLFLYQWNWDFGFTALGIWHLNRRMVWQNISIRLMMLG